MLRYVKRDQLDIKKYDDCIEQSIQTNIYGYSWYLDCIVHNWDVLVLGDYLAVMPIPFRKKYFVSYAFPPLWHIHLGIYSKDQVVEDDFVDFLIKHHKKIELRTNPFNNFLSHSGNVKIKRLQIIELNQDYELIKKAYNRNRKRELNKAKEFGLYELWSDKANILIDLFKNNVGVRLQNVKDQDYANLQKLINTCLKNNKGKILTIYDAQHKLVAGAFFVMHGERVTELVCSSDFSNRDNGANTFMNDRAIQSFRKKFKVFDFGGSSMEGIAKYYHSFGAIDENYAYLSINQLPKWIAFFKS